VAAEQESAISAAQSHTTAETQEPATPQADDESPTVSRSTPA
jgi:hypothetical protein